MDQIEQPDDRADFPALQLPDKMPPDRRAPQGFDLGQRLLQAILPGQRQSRSDRLPEPFDRNRLGRRDKPHTAFRPAGRLCSATDPFVDEPETIPD